MGRPAVRTALLICLLALFPWPARGYVPSLEELFARLAYRLPVASRAIIETRVTVYDTKPAPGGAAAGSEAGEEAPLPAELGPLGFRQTIYWIRGELITIETSSLEGTPLHLYFDPGLGPVAADLTKERHFAALDVGHPYLPFLDGTLAGWREGLGRWGIFPAEVRLERAYKARLLYRLEDPAGGFALLDPEKLRLRRIEARVGVGENAARLTLEFGDNFLYGEKEEAENVFTFPRTVDFFLDGRLFKRITLVRLRLDPALSAFPLDRLRRQAGALVTAQAPLPGRGSTP